MYTHSEVAFLYPLCIHRFVLIDNVGCSDMQFYTELLQAGTHKTLIRHMKNAERVCNQEAGTYIKSSVVLIIKNNLSHTSTCAVGDLAQAAEPVGRGGGGHLGYVPSLKRILRIMPPPFKLLGMVTFVTAFAVTDH